MERESNAKKKPYEAPAIIHEEIVEAIASICGSGWAGSGETCRLGNSCDISMN